MNIIKTEIPRYALECSICLQEARYRIAIINDDKYECIVHHLCPQCEMKIKQFLKDSEAEK